jgi:hypothetical protein
MEIIPPAKTEIDTDTTLVIDCNNPLRKFAEVEIRLEKRAFLTPLWCCETVRKAKLEVFKKWLTEGTKNCCFIFPGNLLRALGNDEKEGPYFRVPYKTFYLNEKQYKRILLELITFYERYAYCRIVKCPTT